MMVNQDGAWQQNADGSWSEAIPYPLFVGFDLRKCKCSCGKKFKTEDLYREHYKQEHTDGKKYERTIQGLKELS